MLELSRNDPTIKCAYQNVFWQIVNEHSKPYNTRNINLNWRDLKFCTLFHQKTGLKLVTFDNSTDVIVQFKDEQSIFKFIIRWG